MTRVLIRKTVTAVIFVICLGCVAFAKLGDSSVLPELTVPYPWETAEPQPPSSYLDWTYNPAPSTSRYPANAETYSVNLFEHPKVKESFLTASEAAKSVCMGPQTNIDVWLNRELVENDLVEFQGYNVFSLDCRSANADPLIAFIIVMGMDGDIVAVHNPPVRAESVVMYNTDTVLFSCIAGAGSFLWNWKDDNIQKLPILADAHTLQYRHSDAKYYGLYLDDGAVTKYSPSIAVSFNIETGGYDWAFEPEYSHINYLTLSGKFAYVSLRSAGCIQKVDMESNEVMWTLGGKYSNFHMYDRDGNFLDANKKSRNVYRDSVDSPMFGSFQHQHKFQHISDNFYSLFDNNVCSGSRFCNSDSSRLVVLRLDEDQYMASEIFSWETGDQSRIYGGSDLLPSGNILGSSYPDTVYPTVEDRQYHANLWEVTPTGKLAWRVGIKGLNPWDHLNEENPYSHSKAPTEEPPTGWVVYSVERFYDKPVVAAPCQTLDEDGDWVIQLLPHNTIKTQDDIPGILYLYDQSTKGLIGKQPFQFQKSWVPKPITMKVPFDHLTNHLSLLVVNMWEEGTMIDIGLVNLLPMCEDLTESQSRLTL